MIKARWRPGIDICNETRYIATAQVIYSTNCTLRIEKEQKGVKLTGTPPIAITLSFSFSFSYSHSHISSIVSDLKKFVKDLPKITQQKGSLTAHVNFADRISKVCNAVFSSPSSVIVALH